jgi:hypothetical protein
VPVPASAIADDGTLEIRVQNLKLNKNAREGEPQFSDGLASFAFDPDGLELLYRVGGFNDNLHPEFMAAYARLRPLVENNPYPPWVGNSTFHASHRSNLLRKDYAYYSKFGWREPVDLPYYWPEAGVLV